MPSGDQEPPSRLPESKNGGAWCLLHEAAQRMGIGSDAVRKRIAAGTVHARKRGSRWEVWLPFTQTAPGVGVDTLTEGVEPSEFPETRDFRKLEHPDRISGSQEPPSGSPDDATLAAVAEMGAGLVTPVGKLQEENRNLAGQVGFLQAQSRRRGECRDQRESALRQRKRPRVAAPSLIGDQMLAEGPAPAGKSALHHRQAGLWKGEQCGQACHDGG